MKSQIALLGLIAAAVGCKSSSLCGEGDRTEFEDETFCYYRAAITEEGFRCPEALPFRMDFSDFSLCSESEEVPEGIEEHVRDRLGDAGIHDGGMDADAGETTPIECGGEQCSGQCCECGEAPPYCLTEDWFCCEAGPQVCDDVGTECFSGCCPYGEGLCIADDECECWSEWSELNATVEAVARPTSAAMRLTFTYGNGLVTLTELQENTVVQASDGPFDPDTNSGSWVELRNDADEVLYTRLAELIPESLESPGADGGFVNSVICPADSTFVISSFSNDSEGTQVVLFQEALDGQITGETIELARFTLPE